jgi:hypothetical protein
VLLEVEEPQAAVLPPVGQNENKVVKFTIDRFNRNNFREVLVLWLQL